MKVNDAKIIDQIVSIDINRRTSLVDNNKAHSVIAISTGFQYNVGSISSPTWKTISELNAIANNNQTIDTKTFIVDQNIDLAKIKFTSDDTKSQKLKDFIKFYFLEGGESLHIREVNSTSGQNSLNVNIVYAIGIQLCIDTEMKIFISDNVDRKLHFIVDEASAVTTSNRIFKMNTYGNFFYLSHVSAYLENLTLDYDIKDYNYTKTNAIIPSTQNNVVVGSENTLVNIGGEGIAIGGELIDGINLVQSYSLQLLENSLKSALFKDMTNKPNRSQATIIFYNTISNILDKYYTNGALDSGVYQAPSHKINYNGKQYVVIEKGEYLDKGYFIYIVDINDASAKDIEDKRMTPISIILLMANQIRFIHLDMEVF